MDELRDHDDRRGEEGREGNREIGVWLKHRGRHAIILRLPFTMSAEIVDSAIPPPCPQIHAASLALVAYKVFSYGKIPLSADIIVGGAIPASLNSFLPAKRTTYLRVCLFSSARVYVVS